MCGKKKNNCGFGTSTRSRSSMAGTRALHYEKAVSF